MKKARQYLAFLLALMMLAGIMPAQYPRSRAAPKGTVKKVALNKKVIIVNSRGYATAKGKKGTVLKPGTAKVTITVTPIGL